MVSVYPARWCTSPPGDVANLPRVCLFISLFISFGENRLYSFSKSMVFGFSLPLGMLVAKREPTPCYDDSYSVGTLTGHLGREAGKCIIRPRFPPSLDVSLW